MLSLDSLYIQYSLAYTRIYLERLVDNLIFMNS